MRHSVNTSDGVHDANDLIALSAEADCRLGDAHVGLQPDEYDRSPIRRLYRRKDGVVVR